MGIRLFVYLFILFLGSIVGLKKIVSEKVLEKVNIIQISVLLVLLFVMGIRIGLDKKVVSSFLELGFQAVIISIFSIFFSILFIRLIKKYIVTNKVESDCE